MPEKFFLISQVFYPDQVSTASLFTDLCSEMASQGVEVEVWSAQPSYTDRERQPSVLVHNGIKIRYLFSTNFRKTNVPGKIFNILTFSISSSFRLLLTRDKKPVWTHTTPPLLAIILSLICKLKKRKFVYILLDIFPEGLVRLGKLSRKNIFVRLSQHLFERTLRRSDKVIVLGRDMKDWIVEICPDFAERINYVPHWHSENVISPGPFLENPMIARYSLQNKFVVQYCGNMGLWNDMSTIGKTVSMNLHDVVYLLIGDGITKKDLTDKLNNKDLSNFKLLPFQSKEELSNTLAACHVHLVTLKKGLEGMAVPSKIYGILASGRPVIALVPENSEIAQVIREENCGIIVDPEDSEELARAIVKLQNDENIRGLYCKNSRKAFEEKYTVKKISGLYRSILLEISL